MSYPSFPSIERLENIYCVITEKIDGTNGLIEIRKDSEIKVKDVENIIPSLTYDTKTVVKFGSRNRYLSYQDDNAGFANFYRHYTVRFEDMAKDIIIVSNQEANQTNDIPTEKYPLQIYGEWFGQTIQRQYGLKDKFFMPFSTFYAEKLIEYQVPNIIKPTVLYTGKFDWAVAEGLMHSLLLNGSQVIPGFMRPEGIVIHFPKYNFRLKETFEGAKWKNLVPKSEHDKKPKEIKIDYGTCHICGKRLYPTKDGSGIPRCMNYHCSENPNNKIDGSAYNAMCNRESDTLYLGE